MVNFWQRKYYFVVMNQHSFHWKRTLLRPKPSPSTRERLLYFVRCDNKLSLRESVLYKRSNLQVWERDCFTSFAVTTSCHCERALFAKEAIPKYEKETASLRSQGQQAAIARERTLRTKQSPSTRGRLLHFVRSDNKLSLGESALCERSNLQVWEGDCFTSFAVTTDCH